MKSYVAGAGVDAFASARNTFNCLIGQLTDPQTLSWSHDRLEDTLAEQGRELLRLLLQAHLDLRADRERARAERLRGTGAGMSGVDGIERRRLENGHHRLLATVFGTVTVTRCAWRAPEVCNAYPADEQLSLPAGRHSHGLARLAAVEAVRGSFDDAQDAIGARCGNVVGKRQLLQLVRRAAVDIDAFNASLMPVPRTAEELLVISSDQKGVVMRPEALRPATAKAAARATRTFRTRLAAGEKAARKRMATLGAVYDAVPAPRRPHDVIAVPGGRRGDRPSRPGPVAHGKWFSGSVLTEPDEVIRQAFDQATARDPTHARTWVVLVDGARHQLDLIRAEAARRKVSIHIVIDFIHVVEKIWAGAWDLHQSGDSVAEDWVATHALALLAGHTDQVITALGAQAAGLPARRREQIDTAIRYLTGHTAFLRDDQALAAGWPIATGVIEGAIRHIVADRLDIGGARWGLAGAEAVLKLRTLVANGSFPEYWRFHLAREHHRVHRTPGQGKYDLTA
ncbi:ISKra4 family transposase [Actinomadura rubrisoli]|uniref:ISKra4 family transposase n=1 Tax=Actinomadura rubrisoli TaxID=2530368 RepID=A0A4R5AJ85_9ACTN|nr:ISKra4 family transposase [Actinomadura rubrisoli]TDD72868.1 ISKra4 family transposase [Actinomadura rubrisoli]